MNTTLLRCLLDSLLALILSLPVYLLLFAYLSYREDIFLVPGTSQVTSPETRENPHYSPDYSPYAHPSLTIPGE